MRYPVSRLILAGLTTLALICGGSFAPSPDLGTAEAAQATGPTAITSSARAEGRVVVKFRPGTSTQSTAAVLADEGLTSRRLMGRSGAQVLELSRERQQAVLERLRARPDVEYAEPDYVVRKSASVTPTDPLFASDQWDLTKISMPDAWGITTGTGIVVAVIDSGITPTHQDLATQWQLAPGRTPQQHVFLTPPVEQGCSIPTSPIDDDGHGTHVSGTIAAVSTVAGGPAVGMAGIAPGARILPLKALDCVGTGFLTDVADAIDFATANGAHIINMSLGSVLPSCPSYLRDSITRAVDAGVFLAAAAGNDGNNSIQVPASCAGIVGVGATDINDVRAVFSNVNSTVDLVAPGTEIWNTSTSTFRGILSAWLDGGYARSSGTSMSTPHVAGCAALVRAASGGINGAQILFLLQGSAIDLGPPGIDTSYGAGRINCGAAVAQAAGTSIPTPTASPTSTGSPGPSVTPTRTPTVTATRTPTQAPPTGGRGFSIERLPTLGLSSAIQTRWTGGSAQAGYLLARLSASGNVFLPPGGVPLPPNATGFLDSGLLQDPMYCYLLFPVQGNPPSAIATSDGLCALTGLRSGASAEAFNVRLDESSTATLSWLPPPNAPGATYLLAALNGNGLRTTALGQGALTAFDNTAGIPTCYAIYAFLNGQLLGNTDGLCAVPGLSHF